MNRFIRNCIALGASAVTAGGIALPAFAASHSLPGHVRSGHDGSDLTDMIAPVTGSGTIGPWLVSDASAIDRQIRHLPAGSFSVVGLDATEKTSISSSFRLRAAEPRYLAGLHRAIESNRPLLAQLEARNIELRNVIGAQPAADGTVTFYVM